MEWITWTRCEWLAWQWEHPWTFAVAPLLLAAYLVASKIKNR